MPSNRTTPEWAEVQWTYLSVPNRSERSAALAAATRRPGPQSKADATTSESLRLTQAATDLREANVARLRQARLDKETRDRAEQAATQALAAPAKPRRSRAAAAPKRPDGT